MSRAEYFKKRRREMYGITTLLRPEEGENLEKILKAKNIKKTDWIRQKIEEDLKNL